MAADALDDSQELIQIVGLGGVRTAPQLVHVQDVLFVCGRRQNHHRQMTQFVLLDQFSEHFAAVYVRHVQV